MKFPVAGHFPAGEVVAELLADGFWVVAGEEGDAGVDFLEALVVAAGGALDVGGGDAGEGGDDGLEVVGADFAAGDVDGGADAVGEVEVGAGDLALVEGEVGGGGEFVFPCFCVGAGGAGGGGDGDAAGGVGVGGEGGE